MKCKDCNFNYGVEGGTTVVCTFTAEERALDADCICESTRIRREKEARLLAEKADAVEALETLVEKFYKPSVDPRYILDILTDTSKDAEARIAEVTEYLEEFV